MTSTCASGRHGQTATYPAAGCKVWKAVHVFELMQGGLARGALLAPSQSPKGKVSSILGRQHASRLTLLSHAQCDAGSCDITKHMLLKM